MSPVGRALHTRLGSESSRWVRSNAEAGRRPIGKSSDGMSGALEGKSGWVARITRAGIHGSENDSATCPAPGVRQLVGQRAPAERALVQPATTGIRSALTRRRRARHSAYATPAARHQAPDAWDMRLSNRYSPQSISTM